MTEPMIPTCSQDLIFRISTLRERGFDWETIAHKVGRSSSTVRRYHRVFGLYGYEAFAAPRDGDMHVRAG